MPTTIRRRRRDSRRALSGEQAVELLTGRIDGSLIGYTGYGDGKSTNVADFVSEQMRLDWEANRETLLKVWRSGEAYPYDVWRDWPIWRSVEHDGNALPWAERVFGSAKSASKAGRPDKGAPAATAGRLRAQKTRPNCGH